MNISALKIYCDVVRHKSFSRAASENEISQSAVSQCVLQLEKNLGVQLLDRTKRPFQLTEEGVVYYQGCKELVGRYYVVENEVKTLRGQIRGTVRVAAIYSAGLGEVSRCVQRFTRNYPDCHVRLSYLHPDQVYDSVLEGDADLGLISYPTPKRDIASLNWRDEPMVLACAPNHPLASKSNFSLEDLRDEPYIAFDEELIIRKQIDRYLRENGIDISIVMSFDNGETVKRAVELQEGVSILPEPTISSELRSGSLVAISLPPPGLVRPLGIIYQKNQGMMRAASRFVKMLQEKEFENTQKDDE